MKLFPCRHQAFKIDQAWEVGSSWCQLVPQYCSFQLLCDTENAAIRLTIVLFAAGRALIKNCRVKKK